MAERPDSKLDEGTMLAHYRVQAELGAGAMGTVYLAHDTALDRSVAVKVLHREISQDPDIVRRFEREARAAARVNHPNLTHVYFVGAEDDRQFFAMEHVPGESLFEHVTDHGPLDLTRAIDALVQAARGLGAAHKADVIHRDVKPSNLMLLPDGTVKVADFGLAKSLSGDVDATGAGRVMGTPRYMSPEQCRGEVVDKSSDAYSLGLVGYFVLTGQHAFEGESLGKVIHGQMNEPLPSVLAQRPELPPAIDDVLARLCAKKPEDRPESMAEVERLLETLRPRRLDPAPLLARAIAVVIDFCAALLVVGAASSVVMLAARVTSARGDWWDWLFEVGAWAAFTFVHFGMERWLGGSPGKLLLHMRVLREDGTRPGVTALALRFVLRYPGVAVVVVGPWFGSVQGWIEVAFGGIQVLAIGTGLVCTAFLRGLTMSDALTRTRVVHHSATDAAAP